MKLLSLAQFENLMLGPKFAVCFTSIGNLRHNFSFIDKVIL